MSWFKKTDESNGIDQPDSRNGWNNTKKCYRNIICFNKNQHNWIQLKTLSEVKKGKEE